MTDRDEWGNCSGVPHTIDMEWAWLAAYRSQHTGRSQVEGDETRSEIRFHQCSIYFRFFDSSCGTFMLITNSDQRECFSQHARIFLHAGRMKKHIKLRNPRLTPQRSARCLDGVRDLQMHLAPGFQICRRALMVVRVLDMSDCGQHARQPPGTRTCNRLLAGICRT